MARPSVTMYHLLMVTLSVIVGAKWIKAVKQTAVVKICIPGQGEYSEYSEYSAIINVSAFYFDYPSIKSIINERSGKRSIS